MDVGIQTWNIVAYHSKDETLVKSKRRRIAILLLVFIHFACECIQSIYPLLFYEWDLLWGWSTPST